MIRLPSGALLVGLIAGVATADDMPKGGGVVGTMRVQVEGDRLLVVTKSEGVRKLTVTDRNGGEEKERVIEVKTTSTSTEARELKHLRISGTDDKDIPLADFKERFKAEGYVVWLESPLDPTWKAKFRNDTGPMPAGSCRCP